jgi:hypothetical protein
MRFSKPIRLQTPDSVELEFWLAGTGRRTLVVDYTVWGLLLSLFYLNHCKLGTHYNVIEV